MTIIAVGIVLLFVSLLVRGDEIIAFAASWTGAILVVVGVGKLIFLD